jgi:ABC-type protease/lipase transport system fused ATPase/permease subunit
MSPSEEASKLAVLLLELNEQIERTIEAGEITKLLPSGVTTLVSGAIKIYAAMIEDAAQGAAAIPVIDGTISTTESMVMACALLRAHHLNPFDLALWFSRTAPGGRRSSYGA